jgi:serine/threonine protein kinase
MNLVHGFIKPSTIIVTNSSNLYKKFSLMDMSLIVGVRHGLEQMMLPDNSTYYPLSPRVMAALKNQTPYTAIYDSSDDIWSLGVTLLCFIFFEDFNIYYNWDQKEINLGKIQSHLEVLKGNSDQS